jgi:methionyl-tRNA formyltransferase
LHWGLSPYYRGVFCTEWALINWDPYNIGVTIHRLSNIVDGGDILAQARAEVTAADTAHSINMQLTVLGTALVIEALNRNAAGQAYEFVRQDLSRGHAVYRRQWSDQLSRQITHIERHGLIGAMLRKPSRPERLPVVSLA